MFTLGILITTLVTHILAQAPIQRGFNYGGIGPNGPRSQRDFEAAFNRAKTLPNTAPFTSARLFTMIQANTADDPTAAIPAAIATNTTLLLGLWASAGQDAFNQELSALQKGLDQFGQAFVDLIVGISVGSEDLYRISPTGIENKSDAGASPEDIVKYIQQVRDKLSGTHDSLKNKIGHVDTWPVWTNETNKIVTQACDWIGMDAYPYYQKADPNDIAHAKDLFFQGYDTTVAVSQGKPVLITEMGWPVQGPDFGLAHPSVENAKRFWDDVGCALFGKISAWWFTLDDTKSDPNALSFSVVKPNLGDPIWDLGCPA